MSELSDLPDNVEIRQVSAAEAVSLKYHLNYAFRPSPPLNAPGEDEQLALQPYFEDGINLLLFEDNSLVSGAFSTTMMQNVRGQLFPMSGVWDVATLPEGRRKGFIRALMLALFEATRDEGQPVSMLYPSRASFYQALGYVGFPQPKVARFSPAPLAPLLGHAPAGYITYGRISEHFDAYRSYLEQHQPVVNGMALRNETADRVRLDWYQRWVAIAHAAGEPQGIIIYRITDDALVADAFFYSTGVGKFLLLEWLARHIDQVDTVALTLPPTSTPETWFTDLRIRPETHQAPMGRVIDLHSLDELPAGPGRFKARVIDPQCPWNEGTYEFASEDGELRIRPTDAADLSLTIQAVTALVYGTHDPEDFRWRGWGNPDYHTGAVMRAMFPTTRPYLHEVF